MSWNSKSDLWRHVLVSDKCWRWQGYYKTGKTHAYGYVSYRGRRESAHRLAWLFFNGPVPPGMVVCHRCDNPGCVRPAHLFLGTQAENMADMVQKKRFWSKLSPADIPLIRRAAERGERLREIAGRHGVSRRTINDIVHRRTWSHVA